MSTEGAAFLVARTRTHGYRLMLAPRGLVDRGRHALIVRLVRPDDDTTVRTVHDDGRTVSVVSSTHRLSATDLEPSTASVLDEHGRPIDLVYGFVCPVEVREVAAEDLAHARVQALAAYRRAAADEDAIGPLPAAPFPLRSAVGSQLPAGRGPVWAPGRNPRPGDRPTGAGTVGTAGTAVVTDRVVRSSRGRPRLGLLVAGAAAVLTGLAGAVVLATGPNAPPSDPPPISPPITPPILPELAGTWQGELHPAGDDPAAARAVTIELDCRPGCAPRPGEPVGQVRDARGCTYALAMSGIADRMVTLEVRPVLAGEPCLPAGDLRLTAPPHVDAAWLVPPGQRLLMTARSLRRG